MTSRHAPATPPQAWPGAGAPNWPSSRLTAAALWRLAHLITYPWAGAAVGLAPAGLGALPWTRRRFWCVLTRHRLQRLCWEARLHTRSGRLPLVLWARPTKVGVRAAHPVPRRDLRRGLRRPPRRTARGLLRPGRPGHPQPHMVPAGDHRHHPPRHPRRREHHHLPTARPPAPPARTGPHQQRGRTEPVTGRQNHTL